LYSFFQLTNNEWLKLAKKKSFFIAFLIMVLMPLGIAVVIKNFLDGTELGYVEFMQSVVDFNGGGSIYVFLCMIYTASIVSSEYQFGTIKLLLIRAHSRSKILASKYAALVLFVVALMAFSLVVSFLISGLFFGFQSEGSMIDVWKTVGYTLIYTFIYSTIIFMLSVLTKSTGATIGITFCLVFIEGLVTMLLARYEFAKYLLFFNMNLRMYEDGGMPIIEGMTLGFSITVIIVHLIAILGLSFYVFNKRDVS